MGVAFFISNRSGMPTAEAKICAAQASFPVPSPAPRAHAVTSTPNPTQKRRSLVRNGGGSGDHGVSAPKRSTPLVALIELADVHEAMACSRPVKSPVAKGCPDGYLIRLLTTPGPQKLEWQRPWR